MSSSENFSMDGEVHDDEFVLEVREANKVVRSYNSKKKKAITGLKNTKDG